MQTLVIVLHLMIVLALIGVVLMQKSEGGALGMGGGGGLTSRGSANVLTRATLEMAARIVYSGRQAPIWPHDASPGAAGPCVGRSHGTARPLPVLALEDPTARRTLTLPDRPSGAQNLPDQPPAQRR